MVLNCPQCNSSEIAKKGFRKNHSGKKQRYQCTSCDAWFVEDDGFKRMRHTPEVIVRAVHQHEDGLSLSKVQNHLWQHDNVKITRWTISKWKSKYSDFLK
jgi:transposase-like protein